MNFYTMLRALVAWALCTTGSAQAQTVEPLSLSADSWSAYALGTANEAESAGLEGLRSRVQALAPPTVGVFAGRPNTQRSEAPEVKIHYRLYENPQETRGGIVIFSGRTEGAELYLETIADLLRNGWSVYIHDHRGQGFSSRLLPKDVQATKGYVDEFGNYVDDAQVFVDRVVMRRQGNPRPLFLMAHSMGGAVASLLLERGAAPFKAAVLVTPMHQPWAAGEGSSLLTLSADALCALGLVKVNKKITGLSDQYPPGSGDFDDRDKSVGPMSITSSPQRLKLNWQARAASCQGAACGHENAKVGGLTWRWLAQACAASSDARGPNAARINVPVLVLQGENDRVVEPSAQQEFCRNMNAGKSAPLCQLRQVPQGRHALLIERDEIRRPVLGHTMGFFDCVAREGSACR